MSTQPLLQPTGSRGHKKRERTRRSLVEAALRLIARNELGDICLHDVAAEALVSNGTIYNYFRTREELVQAVGLTMASDYSQAIAELCRDIASGAQRVALGVRLFIRRAQADPPWANALLRVVNFDQAARSTLIANVLADLQDGRREGAFDFGHELLALEVVLGCATAAMRAVIEGQPLEAHDSLMAERVLRALGMPAEAARALAFAPLPVGEESRWIRQPNR